MSITQCSRAILLAIALNAIFWGGTGCFPGRSDAYIREHYLPTILYLSDQYPDVIDDVGVEGSIYLLKDGTHQVTIGGYDRQGRTGFLLVENATVTPERGMEYRLVYPPGYIYPFMSWPTGRYSYTPRSQATGNRAEDRRIGEGLSMLAPELTRAPGQVSLEDEGEPSPNRKSIKAPLNESPLTLAIEDGMSINLHVDGYICFGEKTRPFALDLTFKAVRVQPKGE